MPRGITFNGITLKRPGGITRVNAAGLNQVTASANSLVALIGEAEGGAPGTEGIVSMADATRADQFRSGPLVDAIRNAFQASNDPAVPGGASEVFVYKTNNSTKSSISLPDSEADTLVDSTASGGSTSTVEDTSLSDTVDDQYNGKLLVLRPFASNVEVREITDYVASSNTFTVDPVFSTTAAMSDDYLVLENSVELADAVDDGSSTSTVVAFKDAEVEDDEHNGRWVYIQDTASISYLRKIVDTDGTANTITVSPALPATPTAGAFVEVLANVVDLTSDDWGAHTNDISVDISNGVSAGSRVATVTFQGEEEVSPDIGGRVVMNLLYRGGAIAHSDTVAASPTATTIPLTTGGLTPSDHVGQQVKVGDEYTVITANTASELTVSPALSEVPAAGTAVEIRTVTGGTFQVDGSAGVATGLSTSISGVSGDDLSVQFSSGQSLRDLVSEINANPSYLASIPAGVNPDTTLVSNLDFGASTEGSVLVSPEIAEDGLTRDLQALVDYFNEFSEFVNAVRSSDTGSAVAGSNLPANTDDGVSLTGGTRGTSSNSDFQTAMDEFLKIRVNSVVPQVDQDLAEEGKGSTATVASVAAQLADHVAQARGAAQNVAGERGGFIGFRGTKSEIISQANAINDADVALVAQNPTTLNASGSLQEFGPRILATMAASMRAGVSEVATPLTHKYLRVSGLTQDSSWSPKDLTDANDMIDAGVLFAETVEGQGTRWVRDLTTWVVNDNLAYMEGSVRDAIRFLAYELRTGIRERFTGKKATPATISSIKDVAASILEVLRGDNVIVDSTDPATGAFVRAWHSLRVISSGDTVTIQVGVFPVPGINFQLHDIFLQLPTQSA